MYVSGVVTGLLECPPVSMCVSMLLETVAVIVVPDICPSLYLLESDAVYLSVCPSRRPYHTAISFLWRSKSKPRQLHKILLYVLLPYNSHNHNHHHLLSSLVVGRNHNHNNIGYSLSF